MKLHTVFSYFLYTLAGCTLLQGLLLQGNFQQKQAEASAWNMPLSLLPSITRTSVFNFTVAI